MTIFYSVVWGTNQTGYTALYTKRNEQKFANLVLRF